MTIELQPEVEALLRQRMERGGFNSVEEVLEAIVKSTTEAEGPASGRPKPNFAQFLMESPLPGSGLVLERTIDYPRTVDL
jgi:hypothetical protein